MNNTITLTKHHHSKSIKTKETGCIYYNRMDCNQSITNWRVQENPTIILILKQIKPDKSWGLTRKQVPREPHCRGWGLGSRSVPR